MHKYAKLYAYNKSPSKQKRHRLVLIGRPVDARVSDRSFIWEESLKIISTFISLIKHLLISFLSFFRYVPGAMESHDDIPLKEMVCSTIPLDLIEENEQYGTSTATINYEYSGNLSTSLAQKYPSSALDIFVEVKATVDMFLNVCALKKVPGPEHKDKVLVYDLSVSESTANKPRRLRTSCDNWEIENLIKSDDTDILIRMIFVEIDTITVEGLRELGHHYSIPARFWGSNSNGDFGHRTLKSGLDEITYITWLEILTKPVVPHEDTPVPENDGIYWYRPCFSFKWQYCGLGSRNKYKLVMFCLDSSPHIQERLGEAIMHTNSQLILKDPYSLYCLTSSQWYDWNLDAYFRLRSQLVGIERRATSTRLESFEPEFEPSFPTLHKLARDIIQMAEVSQSAIFVMERLVHEHERFFHLFGESEDVYSRVEATLNERLTLFKGTLASYEALGKRLTNLINFAFNVVAQRESKLSVQIAKATQSDSNSMRSIAVVTLIFLPGTAIASIFSTPFFDCNSSHPFWIYWALTIPLTVVIVVIWYMFGREERSWVPISNLLRERWRRIMDPLTAQKKEPPILPK